MKKNATIEEKIEAATKVLLKKFKASEDKREIGILHHFTRVISSKLGEYVSFKCWDGKKPVEIDFGNLSESGLGDVSCKIADAIVKKLKLKKGEIIHREVEEHDIRGRNWWVNYGKYRTTERLEIVRPCKEFFAINKKLKALGLNEINFKDWYVDYVSGKRSSIFSHDVSYYAEDSEKCQKVLAYLKGKKKLSYDYVNDDCLDDRERGIKYETEWEGRLSKQIRFKDAKGKTFTIW